MKSEEILERYKKILRIRINHSYADFFSYVNFIVNQLRYCEQNKLFPVVYFGTDSTDGPNAFYEKAVGDNSWDYYFEPVAGLSYQDVLERIANPDDVLSNEHIFELDDQQLWYLHSEDPDSIYNYPYGYYANLAVDEMDRWYAEQQQKARYYVAKYIKPKQQIRDQVKAFWNRHFKGKEVIGVHLRGSDKGAANTTVEAGRIIPPEEYYPYLDRFVSEVPDGKLFVATNQVQFLQQLQDRYGEKVVARDVVRADTIGTSANPIQAQQNHSYKLGEEVLIDCLLLAKTDVLMCSVSAVSEYAMYFSPDLISVNLSILPKSHNEQKIDLNEFFGEGKLFEGAILINLDSRPDRLQQSLGELEKYGMDNWPVRMSAFKHENRSYGCSRSHVEAIRYARWKGWKSVLIFEDDIKISNDFDQDAYKTFKDLAESEWAFFQFGVMNINKTETVSNNLYRHKNGQAAHAYALHESAYDYIIDNYVCDPKYSDIFKSGHMPFDEYINNYFPRHYPSYAAKKLLISQHAGFSNIVNQQTNYEAMLEEKYKA